MTNNPLRKIDPEIEIQVRDTEIRRLEVKNQLLKAQNSRLNREKRTNLQAEFIAAEFHNALQLAVPAFEPLDKVNIPKISENSDEVLVIHLSDEHADEIVLPERVNGLEEYNFNIACRRAERYIDGIIDWKNNKIRQNFTKAVIFCYGDHVSGTIHKGTENSHFRNQFANSLAVGQLHGLMFRELAAHFDSISVVYVVGNHGRVDPQKNMRRALENLDYLVAETAALCCRDIDNLDFNIPDSYSAIVVVNGHRFHVSHGDDVKTWGGMPWYGLSKRTNKIQAIHYDVNQPINYHVTGHFHSPGTVVISAPRLKTAQPLLSISGRQARDRSEINDEFD